MPEYETVLTFEDLDAEGQYTWNLEAYAMALENELAIKALNISDPQTPPRPVPPRPPRPTIPPRPTPRPVPERPPFVDPWA